MKCYCISNNKDMAIQMRLSGIPSIYLKEDNEIIKKVDELLKDEQMGLLVISEELINKSNLPFKEIMEKRKMPLVVPIPNIK